MARKDKINVIPCMIYPQPNEMEMIKAAVEKHGYKSISRFIIDNVINGIMSPTESNVEDIDLKNHIKNLESEIKRLKLNIKTQAEKIEEQTKKMAENRNSLINRILTLIKSQNGKYISDEQIIDQLDLSVDDFQSSIIWIMDHPNKDVEYNFRYGWKWIK